MEAELTALAASGATAFVQQMATDSWGAVRDRIVAFFQRGTAESEVEEQLETSRGELAAAAESGDQQVAADVEAEWRTRLRRRLLADPAIVQELRALLHELPRPAGHEAVEVHNTISGGVQHGPVIQAGTMGSLSLGVPPRPVPPPAPQESPSRPTQP
ncbi:hypothetical protein [Streptomyces sp. AcH 505]|uniref:hypothetical protein n=1 Tax=Streptomyces sp. AcH 505 TaxID=352211 RepID=UPI0005A68B67